MNFLCVLVDATINTCGNNATDEKRKQSKNNEEFKHDPIHIPNHQDGHYTSNCNQHIIAKSLATLTVKSKPTLQQINMNCESPHPQKKLIH